jgi:hypothetical protein
LWRWRAKYTKTGVITGVCHSGGPHAWLLESEDLIQKARKWCRENARKNFTAHDFLTHFLQKTELTRDLISTDTARRYLHRIGWRHGSAKSGSYIDGHERADVAAYREVFCEEFLKLLRDPIVVFVFQDETVYHAKEGITRGWAADGASSEARLRKKGLGKGVMASAWVTQEGILQLSPEQKLGHPELQERALFILNFGGKWGYYDWKKFEEDAIAAIEMARACYPRKKIVMLYDHSSVHRCMADDALNAKKMNLSPGGMQPLMRSTVYCGVPQEMVFPIDHSTHPGQAKGLRAVLEERGVNTSQMKKETLVEILASHDDFKNERCKLEKIHEAKGVKCMFLPKFHCEFNPAELIWALSKRFCRANCTYCLPGLLANIPRSFLSVSSETYRACFQHSLEEIVVSASGGKSTSHDEAMKIYKSHRPPVGQVPWAHLINTV